MVDVDGSSHFPAESQPKLVGMVATRRSVCIRQMNRVNSCNGSGPDDSTINISVCMYYYYYYYYKEADNSLRNERVCVAAAG